MATRSNSLGDDLKAWAQDQLQVGAEAAPDQVRAAFLRQVEHDNGTPNLTAREALLILTGRHGAARPALALEAAEEALQRAVDDFASRFFALPIAERKAEWQNLNARGQGFVRVDIRLTHLRPGLDVALPNLAHDAPLDALASVVGKLFVLRPAARAAARQAYLDDAHRQDKWAGSVRAAELLRKHYKTIAALAPELIAKLADAQALAGQKAKVNRAMRKAPQPVAAAGGPSRVNSWWWLVPVLIGCTTCLRMMGTGSSVPRNDPPAPMPKILFEMKDLQKDRVLPPFIDGKKPELGATERLFGPDGAKRLRERLQADKGEPAAEAVKDKQNPP